MTKNIQQKDTFYELGTLELCSFMIPEPRFIMDIGANIGNHTLYWGLTTNAKIYSFEPFPENVVLLKKNIASNDLSSRVIVKDLALGNESSRSSMGVKYKNNMGTAMLDVEDTLSANRGATATVKVKTLDSCLRAMELPTLDLIKIDVEGSELNVLAGAKEVLTNYSPLIWVEVWSSSDLATVKGLIKQMGYTHVYRYNESDNYFFSKKPLNVAAAERRQAWHYTFTRGKLRFFSWLLSYRAHFGFCCTG